MADRNVHVDVAIIGAGTAGLNALKEVKSAGKSCVLIDHGPLGTTCARVGCMPSKAVLHAGGLWQGHAFVGHGHGRRNPEGVDPDKLWKAARKTRDMLADGAAKRAVANAGERLIMGRARFVGPDTLDVDGQRVTAKAFIVATGSRPVVPAFLREVQDRVLTTDSVFELESLPRSIGILGLGAIGLELGLALSRLGVRVVAGDVKTVPAGVADPETAARAVRQFGETFTMWLGQPVQASRTPEGVSISSGSQTVEVERVLAALGRKPSIEGLGLDAAGVEFDQNGLPLIDPQTMRAGQSSIYFAGDVSPDRPLMHEAADEGMIAGWNAARYGDAGDAGAPGRFRRRVPLSIVFSDPDIAAVGAAFDQLDMETTVIGSASGQANGRSRVLGAEENHVRIYADKEDGKLLGASIFATRGEHIAHLLAWAIQRGETAESLLEMPFYHPTIEEMVQSALSEIVKQQATRRADVVGLRRLA